MFDMRSGIHFEVIRWGFVSGPTVGKESLDPKRIKAIEHPLLYSISDHKAGKSVNLTW